MQNFEIISVLLSLASENCAGIVITYIIYMFGTQYIIGWDYMGVWFTISHFSCCCLKVSIWSFVSASPQFSEFIVIAITIIFAYSKTTFKF